MGRGGESEIGKWRDQLSGEGNIFNVNITTEATQRVATLVERARVRQEKGQHVVGIRKSEKVKNYSVRHRSFI